jgi:hypothetical protein
VILVLDAQDLLVELGDFLKGVARGDGVDEKETFAGTHVLLAHSSAHSNNTDKSGRRQPS